MIIAMANDHAGTDLKNQIKEWLEEQGHEVRDFGTYDKRWQWRAASVIAAYSWTVWAMAAR